MLKNNSTITLGVPANPYASLFYLAQGLGLFSKRGVNLELVKYPSGRFALKDMVRGIVSMAVAGEIPIVSQSYRRQDLRILCSIGFSDNETWIVGRKDHGIRSPEDLAGKSIGIKNHSGFHHILIRYLNFLGIEQSNVNLVPYSEAKDLISAIERGEVDAMTYAFSIKHPYALNAAEVFGAAMSEIVVSGAYRLWFNLVTTAPFIALHHEMLRELLNALQEAEGFATQQPTESRQIVAKALAVSTSDIEVPWERITLGISLSNEVLVSMEQAAQWFVTTGYKSGSIPPRCSMLIDETVLGLTFQQLPQSC